jgi:DNA adenine methylase
MRYLGGKYFVAKDIAKVINQHKAHVYLEPFMGSCWVTAQIAAPNRIAGDLHEELVELFHQVQQGWIPPDHLSKEEYDDIRAHRFKDKYPKHLMAFAGFGCAFGGSYFRKYAGENYAGYTQRSLMRKIKTLQDVRFYVGDYRDLNPSGCVIYCDPPYEDAYTFRITKVVGNGSFNHKEFWQIMDQWSEKNIVYISERQAPAGYECVMEKTLHARLRGEKRSRVERLFHKPTSTTLTTGNFDIFESLGVSDDWNGFRN